MREREREKEREREREREREGGREREGNRDNVGMVYIKLFISVKTCTWTLHPNDLIERVLMRGHNICFIER